MALEEAFRLRSLKSLRSDTLFVVVPPARFSLAWYTAMFNNPFREYRERKRREREQALEHQRHLALLAEQERRGREQQRHSTRKAALIVFAAGGLVGGLIGGYFGRSYGCIPGRLNGTMSFTSSPGALSEDGRIERAEPEPACKPTVECLDGTMSCSLGSGTCSHHGGIKPSEAPCKPTVECLDGTMSCSLGSGTCSHHGGIGKSKHTSRERRR
jgi:hypothetical protein